MYTGMNFLPLWTAIVCPIISGKIVERRDHVFTTFFSLRVFSASTFSRRWPSMNGPFFSERGIGLVIPPRGAVSPTARGASCGTLAPDLTRGAKSGRKDTETASPAHWVSFQRLRPIRPGKDETKPAAPVQAWTSLLQPALPSASL